VHFVLDIEISVSIIYIWYEEGLLKPFLVTCVRRARMLEWACQAAATGDAGRAWNPDEGGDRRQWRRKPRAGRRRPARNA